MSARVGSVVVLQCPNGHTVSNVYGKPPPLACPACPHGIPCNLPLSPVKPARRAVTA